MVLPKWAGVVLGGLAVVTTTEAARAGETTVRDPWSGVHIGAAGAFSRSVIRGITVTSDGTISGNASREPAHVNDRAAGLGVFIGYRQRFDPGFVAGFEGDVTALNHGSTNVNQLATGQTVATLRYETPVLATGRMTAGWSFGNVLVYGTGGVGLAREQETRTQYRLISGRSEAQFSENANATRAGFVLGAGVEWRLVAGWSLRADYVYARFPKATFQFPDARGGAQGSYTSVQGRIADNGAHMNLVRIGISYTFGAGD